MSATNPTQRDNFIWLLIGLVTLLFSGAVLQQLQLENTASLINISISFTLLVAVWSMERHKAWYQSRIGLTIIVAAIGIGDYFLINAGLDLLQLLFIFSFFCVTTLLACRQILFQGSVDLNKIIGAICIYILLGLTWAFSYLLVEELFPGSMHGFTHSDWHANLQDAVYYSFVTLTTLGYGEITPLQPLARFLAYMEALTGQFYIAILVASLIGIRLADRRGRD
tara:strand:- start:263 stop:934 length:672 start_codon:yes stop_codon:yes gene_type:complete